MHVATRKTQGKSGRMGQKSQNRPPSGKSSATKLHAATVVQHEVRTGNMCSHAERVREWHRFGGFLSNQQAGSSTKKSNGAQIHATSIMWHGAEQPTGGNHGGSDQLPCPTPWHRKGARDYTDSGHCALTSGGLGDRVSIPVRLVQQVRNSGNKHVDKDAVGKYALTEPRSA